MSSDSEEELEVQEVKPAGCLSSIQDLDKYKAPYARFNPKKPTTTTTTKGTLFKQFKQATLLPIAPTVAGVGSLSKTQEKRRSSKIASRMWFKEKGGKRWEERDLHEVLCELRKLR